jgi:hypothetical protein
MEIQSIHHVSLTSSDLDRSRRLSTRWTCTPWPRTSRSRRWQRFGAAARTEPSAIARDPFVQRRQFAVCVAGRAFSTGNLAYGVSSLARRLVLCEHASNFGVEFACAVGAFDSGIRSNLATIAGDSCADPFFGPSVPSDRHPTTRWQSLPPVRELSFIRHRHHPLLQKSHTPTIGSCRAIGFVKYQYCRPF